MLAIVFEIQNTQIRSYNTQLVNVRIGFEQQKCFEHVVRQFVEFRTAEVEAFAAVDEVVSRASARVLSRIQSQGGGCDPKAGPPPPPQPLPSLPAPPFPLEVGPLKTS